MGHEVVQDVIHEDPATHPFC